MSQNRSPVRRNTVGAGLLLGRAIDDLDELACSLSSNTGEDAHVRTSDFSMATRDTTKSNSNPTRRLITYNRHEAPAKSAMKNPRAKRKKKSSRKSVSFSTENIEIDPWVHTDSDGNVDSKDESEEQTTEDAGGLEDRENSEEQGRNKGLRRTRSASAAEYAAGKAAENSEEPSLRRNLSAGNGRISNRPKLTPEERAAKREQALKEAKAAAKNVRKKNRGSITETSEAAKQTKSKSMFKNPFRKTKSITDGSLLKKANAESLEKKAEAFEKKVAETTPTKPKPTKAKSVVVEVGKEVSRPKTEEPPPMDDAAERKAAAAARRTSRRQRLSAAADSTGSAKAAQKISPASVEC